MHSHLNVKKSYYILVVFHILNHYQKIIWYTCTLCLVHDMSATVHTSHAVFVMVPPQCEIYILCAKGTPSTNYWLLIQFCSRLQDLSVIQKIVKQYCPRTQELDYTCHRYPQALSIILEVLRQGLGQRVAYIGVMLPSTQRWSLTEVPPPSVQPITLGFTLNPEFAYSVLDKGPGANLPEVCTCLSAFIL